MVDYTKVKKLSISDAAYLAGLIDGEGTISLTRRHRNENRQLEISISNTDKQLLNFVLKTVGAGRIARKRVTKEIHTPSATYLVSNRQALDFLAQMTPYLHTYKLKRAELVLDEYIRLTPRNGKYTALIKSERDAFVDKFLSITP